MGGIVVVDLFSSLSHRVGAIRRRACFKCGSATLGHSILFCFATFANVPWCYGTASCRHFQNDCCGVRTHATVIADVAVVGLLLKCGTSGFFGGNELEFLLHHLRPFHSTCNPPFSYEETTLLSVWNMKFLSHCGTSGLLEAMSWSSFFIILRPFHSTCNPPFSFEETTLRSVWNMKFLSHFRNNTTFSWTLILVVAKAQHTRQFSAHPSKLLTFQSAIPLEKAVDRTYSDQQLGRVTGRRHNRKTTPLPPTPSPSPFHGATAGGASWSSIFPHHFRIARKQPCCFLFSGYVLTWRWACEVSQ